jgi:hypothetical protein
METLRALNTCHVLTPDTFCFRYRLTLTTAYGDKLHFFFSCRLTLAEIQFIEGVSVALQQLSLFDGEVTMTREPTWIVFIVEKTIHRRKAFRHPARS